MKTPVRDLMSQAAAVVRLLTPSFKEIAELLHWGRLSTVPVIDGEQHLAALVSGADLRSTEWPGGEAQARRLESRRAACPGPRRRR